MNADAMQTQKKRCVGLHAYGGYYLLTVKDNQPTMCQDLVDFFADEALDEGE